MVDMDFGTGAVKITPAHDHNDYDCGKRNGLAFVEMMDDDGVITDVCPQFQVREREERVSKCSSLLSGLSTCSQGMKRFHARTAVLEALKEKGLYKETKEHSMVVPICRYVV